MITFSNICSSLLQGRACEGREALELVQELVGVRLVYRELLGLLDLLGRRTSLEGKAEGRANLGLFCATIWSIKSSSGGEGKGRDMG